MFLALWNTSDMSFVLRLKHIRNPFLIVFDGICQWGGWPSWLQLPASERAVRLQPLRWPAHCFQFSEHRALVPEGKGSSCCYCTNSFRMHDLGMTCASVPLSFSTHILFSKTHKNYVVAPGMGQAKSSILNKFFIFTGFVVFRRFFFITVVQRILTMGF